MLTIQNKWCIINLEQMFVNKRMVNPKGKFMNNEKLKALEAAMGQIEKQFGKGSIMKLGENSILNLDAISTGCLGLRYRTWYWWCT